MLTMFGLPKPFRGHNGVIQRNAITSWALLDPKPEILLFGNEPGTAEVAQELGARYVADVERNPWGTPFLDSVFARARDMATHPVLCYANADMVFLADFIKSVQEVSSWRDRFLMVGRRTNLDVGQPFGFESPDWQKRLRELATRQGFLAIPECIDYFVFNRSMPLDMPRLAVGRPHWDNWFVWKACSLHMPVVDATAVVLAIHQNHDFAHLPQSEGGNLNNVEARQNFKLVGPRRAYTIRDATYRLTPGGMERHFASLFGPISRPARRWWIAFLKATAPARYRLGLRRDNFKGLICRIGLIRR